MPHFRSMVPILKRKLCEAGSGIAKPTIEVHGTTSMTNLNELSPVESFVLKVIAVTRLDDIDGVVDHFELLFTISKFVPDATNLGVKKFTRLKWGS